MKGVVTMTFTRQKSRYLKIGKARRITFDNEQRSFIEVAVTVINGLEDYVRNAASKRAYNLGQPLE
jgi:hypothetical protein